MTPLKLKLNRSEIKVAAPYLCALCIVTCMLSFNNAMYTNLLLFITAIILTFVVDLIIVYAYKSEKFPATQYVQTTSTKGHLTKILHCSKELRHCLSAAAAHEQNKTSTPTVND